MSKPRPRTSKQASGGLLLAGGDIHFPHQNNVAVEVFLHTAEYLKPDIGLLMGDLLDFSHFSSHPATFGAPKTSYEADLRQANAFLDRFQAACGKTILLAGNHEYRLDRWAAAASSNEAAYESLSPEVRLSEGRKNFTYIPYGQVKGTYPHYVINDRMVAVHGWSYAKAATRQHLEIAQGRSILHGHTHRADVVMMQSLWQPNTVLQGRATACLCRPVPLYGVGRPVEWVNGFVVGYMGKRSDTLYTIPIHGGRCILPGGIEVS